MADIAHLESLSQPLTVEALRALAVRLRMVREALLLPSDQLRGVIDDRMQTTPSAKGALAKLREVNRTPAMLAVLGAGWSVRQLATEISTREFAWHDQKPVRISHNQLTRILRGEVPPSSEVRRAVRDVCKIKI